jgi:hypothetical protein
VFFGGVFNQSEKSDDTTKNHRKTRTMLCLFKETANQTLYVLAY